MRAILDDFLRCKCCFRLQWRTPTGCLFVQDKYELLLVGVEVNDRSRTESGHCSEITEAVNFSFSWYGRQWPCAGFRAGLVPCRIWNDGRKGTWHTGAGGR